jgi:hypothetical protein
MFGRFVVGKFILKAIVLVADRLGRFAIHHEGKAGVSGDGAS